MTKKTAKDKNHFNQGLLDFLKDSPTAFHAVANMTKCLQENDFIALDETQSWSLKPGGKYIVTRNQSSLIAFTLDSQKNNTAFRLIGSHTDSPGLRLKPNAEITFRNLIQTGTETYGGLLMAPWFDRDLSLAGRIYFEDANSQIHTELVDLKKPLAIIPSLAIHLDREVNQNKSINPQKELIPLWAVKMQEGIKNQDKEYNFKDLLLQALQRQLTEKKIKKLLSHELYLYDTQAPSYLGWNDDFIASARLDNLLSCYIAMETLVAESKSNALIVCNDHEEVGSNSAIGADGSFLKDVLERIYPEREALIRSIQQSMLISCDNGHAIHPNYPEKHDPQHSPLLNAGPIIKVNANQRYASNGETEAAFVAICEKNKIPYQRFVVRSDMACGSTIGPITAAKLGIKTLDVGVPSLGMHSIREMVGSQDAYFLYQALQEFFSSNGHQK